MASTSRRPPSSPVTGLSTATIRSWPSSGRTPFQLDSKPPALPLEKYIYNETRYTMLTHSNPQAAKHLLQLIEEDVRDRWRVYQKHGRYADEWRGEVAAIPLERDRQMAA